MQNKPRKENIHSVDIGNNRKTNNMNKKIKKQGKVKLNISVNFVPTQNLSDDFKASNNVSKIIEAKGNHHKITKKTTK